MAQDFLVGSPLGHSSLVPSRTGQPRSQAGTEGRLRNGS